MQFPRATHLPLHRQQEIFKRQGVHLPRSTLANLVQGGAALLGTITEAMWRDACEHAAWLAIDATGVLVLATEQCRRGHFWVVVRENGHVLFRYTKKHDGSVPVELLAGFRGYMIADASSVYHELYRSEPGITEVCCWAHARRRFFDAHGGSRTRHGCDRLHRTAVRCPSRGDELGHGDPRANPFGHGWFLLGREADRRQYPQ